MSPEPMLRRGRAAAAVMAVALTGLTATATPASAGTGGFGAPADGAQLVAPVVISGSVDLQTAVDTITLAVELAGGGGAVANVVARCAAPPPGFTCSGRHAQFSWAPDLVRNGPYAVRGSAIAQPDLIGRRDSADLGSRRFGLGVPAASPSGVRALVDSDSHQVLVTWSANPEPDIVGYRVLRRAGSGDWTAVADVDAGDRRSWTDAEATSGGEFAYRVVAYRPDGTGTGTVASAPSKAVTASVPAPTGTTLGAAPGTLDDGGSGGDGSATTRPSSVGSAAVPAPQGVDLSGFGAVRAGAGGAVAARAPKPEARPAQPDTGFAPLLPYRAGVTAPAAAGDDPVVAPTATATFGDTGPDRRTVLVGVAGSLVLFLVAVHLRWLLRRLPATPA